MQVSETDYLSWEREVVAAFYTADKRVTPLFPRHGQPAVVQKQKFLLAAIVDAAVPERVARGETGLPAEVTRKLYHLGKGKLDGVADGLHKSGTKFRYPCFDLGGLTNYHHKLGAPTVFVSAEQGTTDIRMDSKTDLSALAQTLHARWCALTGKALDDELRTSLLAWLVSVIAAMGEATLRFHPTDVEHRVLVTASEVRAATGRYLLRVFGGSSFAVEASVDETVRLYCGVNEKYITPNINERNINLECQTYGVAPHGFAISSIRPVLAVPLGVVALVLAAALASRK